MTQQARIAALIAAIGAAIKAKPPKLLGSIAIGQSNLVTTSIPYVLSAALAGVKSTDIIVFVPTQCPDNRQTGQARCDVDGTVKVWVQGPGLSLLESYTIKGNVYKIA